MPRRENAEAAPQHLAWKLLTWLNFHGYELPGNKEDWHIKKPETWGSSRRSRYDMESGTLSWFLTYTGDNEEAREWSGTFGSDIAPARVVNHLDQFKLVENYDRSGSYKRVRGLKFVLKPEYVSSLPPRKKTVHIWACQNCGNRTEGNKTFGENYIHRQCGQTLGKYVLVDTITVEEVRKTDVEDDYY